MLTSSATERPQRRHRKSKQQRLTRTKGPGHRRAAPAAEESSSAAAPETVHLRSRTQRRVPPVVKFLDVHTDFLPLTPRSLVPDQVAVVQAEIREKVAQQLEEHDGELATKARPLSTSKVPNALRVRKITTDELLDSLSCLQNIKLCLDEKKQELGPDHVQATPPSINTIMALRRTFDWLMDDVSVLGGYLGVWAPASSANSICILLTLMSIFKYFVRCDSGHCSMLYALMPVLCSRCSKLSALCFEL